ncbi:hypothetical protein L1279_003491 [Planomicrobium sp. HSC-17F08]|nr:hypothetical protein [Planomicrobium sp. HSC-17F08]
MRNVILQPSGGAGKENFKNTIQRPVPLEKVLPYLNENDCSLVKSYYLNGLVPVWGVTAGKSKGNQKKWDRIDTGDIALFTEKMQVFASGIVTHKFHSRELALELWGWKEDGVTWEYIYLLDELEERAIPVQKLNEAVGYQRDNVVRGFTVLDEQKSNNFILSFDLMSDVYSPNVSEEKYLELIRSIDTSNSLDAEVMAKRRTEQDYLRKHLFQNKKIASCGICSEEMPVQFLVAAHIKKRKFCSIEEKLDAQNIVMPMCKFGCDELFEKGYIAVVDGKVININNINLTSIVSSYIDKITGKQSAYWTKGTADYFKWHFEYHFEESKQLTNVW